MAQILIAGNDWAARALLRAQLIEEGLEVEAYENVPELVKRLWVGGDMPSLLVADLCDSEDRGGDIATLSHWGKLLPIWILVGQGVAEAEDLDGQGFERVLIRPLDLGPVNTK